MIGNKLTSRISHRLLAVLIALLAVGVCVPQVEARRGGKARTSASSKRKGKKSKRSRRGTSSRAVPVLRPTADNPLPGIGSGATVGVYVKDLRDSRQLMSLNADRVMTPASTMKCVTAASGLMLLGPDYRFVTPVTLDGLVDGDLLRGDITVYSSGDPTLDSRYMPDSISFVDAIVDGLRGHGIRRIEGCVVVNETMQDPGPVQKWEIEDVAYGYGSGIFGLNWKDNTFTLWPATGRTSVPVPGLELNRRSGRGQLRGYDSWRLTVGCPHPGDTSYAVTTTMPWPAESFEAALLERLAADSIAVGEPLDTVNPPYTRRLLEHRSAPLSQILRSMMVRSDNLYAEGVLRALSPGDRDSALRVERRLLDSLKIGFDDAIIYDGSGLTRANKLSPRMLGNLLEFMTSHPMGQTYRELFAKAGEEGTVRRLLADTRLSGQFALKSGSVSGVLCYAGYKLDADGRPTHVVVVMTNGHRGDSAAVREAVQRLLLYLFDEDSEN